MMHSTLFGTLMSILCHWAWLMRASSADPTCYFPNGEVAPTYQPCNSTDDDHASVCCELSTSVCSTKALCYGSNGYVYRGGCTDRSWKSALCPTVCLTVATDTFSPLVPCTHGQLTGDFCCASKDNENCCYRKFQLWEWGVHNGAGIPFVPSIGALSTSLTTSSPSSISSFTSTSSFTPISSSTSTSTSTSASAPLASSTISVSRTPQSSSSKLIAVGLGVGLPLGILLLLNLGFLLFRERRHRINTQQMIQEAIAAAEARVGQMPYLVPSRELSGKQVGVGELDSGQRHEIQASS